MTDFAQKVNDKTLADVNRANRAAFAMDANPGGWVSGGTVEHGEHKTTTYTKPRITGTSLVVNHHVKSGAVSTTLTEAGKGVTHQVHPKLSAASAHLKGLGISEHQF